MLSKYNGCIRPGMYVVENLEIECLAVAELNQYECLSTLKT